MDSAVSTTPEVSSNGAPDIGSSVVETSYTPPTAGELRLEDIFDQGTDITPKEATPADEGTSTQDAGDSTEQASVTEDDQTSRDTASTPDSDSALIDRIAEATGLDPKDPNDRNALEKLAKKPEFIKQFIGDKESQQEPQDQQAPEDELTEYEKRLLAPKPEDAQKPAEQAAAVKPPEQQPPAQPAEPMKYGDAGDDWKTPIDSYNAEAEAWESNDLGKVHAIQLARFARMRDAQIKPEIEALRQQLAEVAQYVPAFREATRQREYEQARDEVIGELAKEKGFDFVPKLFEPREGTVKFRGKEYANTEFNRIIASNPEFANIRDVHPDPSIAQRRTLALQIKAVSRVFRANQKQGIPPEKAREVFQAGRKAQQHDATDRARQAINSGKGSTRLGNAQPEESYVQRIVRNSSAGEKSLTDLFST